MGKAGKESIGILSFCSLHLFHTCASLAESCISELLRGTVQNPEPRFYLTQAVLPWQMVAAHSLKVALSVTLGVTLFIAIVVVAQMSLSGSCVNFSRDFRTAHERVMRSQN